MSDNPTAAPRGAMVLALVVTTVASVTVISHHHRRPHPVALALVPPLPLTVRASRGEHRLPLLPVRTVPFSGAQGATRHHVRPSRPAGAAAHLNWPALALCESSGDWHADTGNGFYGGLQFTAGTWASFGGLAYAPRADLASRAEQITVARRVLAVQGSRAWPACSVRIGVAR